jgi:hypothetical protein
MYLLIADVLAALLYRKKCKCNFYIGAEREVNYDTRARES